MTENAGRGRSVYAVSADEALRIASDDPMVRALRLGVEVVEWWTAEGSLRFAHAPGD